MPATRRTTGAYEPPLTGDAWQTLAPDEAGWDAAALDAALSYAGERNATAVIVLSGGRILAERYWRGWDARRAAAIFSAQKSVTSALVGIALHDGALSLDDPVALHLGGGWSRAPREAETAITLRHLLTMTSGLDDALAFVADAGTRWYYNTPAYYRVKAVLERATGQSMADYTSERLGSRIGWQDSAWVGELLGPPPGQQLRASARDMARFDLLVLRGGRWGGEVVLPDAAYLRESLTASQPLNPAYGYLWWLNGGASFVLPGLRSPTGNGPLVPEAPADMVAALGAADKKIYIVPSRDLVVVRHGDAAGAGAEARSSFDSELWRRLMAAAPA